MDHSAQKRELRQQLLAQRRSLSAADWRAKSDELSRQMLSTEVFQQAQTILAFWSFRQEPMLESLWSSLEGSNKSWGLPRCVGKNLAWHAWSAGNPLVNGAFGIQEPTQSAPLIDPAIADLILVPAVACDRQGNRLGYGGGFYDRLLSRKDCQNIPTIGIVFDFAMVVQLPQDPWDCPLDAVCTERGYFPMMLP